MIIIHKPLTRQISLIFALFVMFSLFIGCGDEGETLKPSATEEETRSLVLLAPGIEENDDLTVSLDYAEGSAKEFTIKKEEDGTYKILVGENTYTVTIVSKKDVKNIKLTYKVKCILNGDIEKEKSDPKFKPTDQCNSQVIISKVDGATENKNEVTRDLGDLAKGSEKKLAIVVKLAGEDKLPPRDVKVRNEVCVEYTVPW